MRSMEYHFPAAFQVETGGGLKKNLGSKQAYEMKKNSTRAKRDWRARSPISGEKGDDMFSQCQYKISCRGENVSGTKGRSPGISSGR